MQKSVQQGSKDGFGIQDVLYILFKHKWKIVFFSILGFAASAAVYANRKPFYQSESTILVEYVLSRTSIDQYQSEMSKSGGPGDQAINTEIEILKSRDVALKVAEVVGVDQLLPEAEGKGSVEDAAGKILGFTEVVVVPMNSVLHISYGSPDPKLSVVVLTELIKQYFAKHLEIHRSKAAFEEVAKQTEEVRIRLKKTENDLDQLRTNSGIISLADAVGALSAQSSRTKENLMAAKAELAEQNAKLRALEKQPGPPAIGGQGPRNGDSEPEKGSKDALPLQIISQYKSGLDVLAILQKRDMELSLKFKPGNRLIALNRQQISEYESRRKDLVERYPDLANEAVLLETGLKSPQLDLLSERLRLTTLTARVEIYNQQLDEIKQLFDEQYAIGSQIDSLERKKQMEDAEYRSMELNLKNAIVDRKLDPSSMPNTKMIQRPSIPTYPTYDKVTQKIILGLAGGGMALGVGLAFLIELLLDRRIKRPIEIQARLQLPLLLSIPYIRRKDRGGLMLSHGSGAPRIGRGGDTDLSAVEEKETPDSAIRRANHFILPYSETVRDRIIFNFEVNNVTHKPKLVAVTGLSEGAGASTIAAGLAKSFSEINGAKVLLVDLSSLHPEENPIFGEIARHSLSGALQLARNTNFKQAAQSLYYASATARRDETGLTTFSPMHLYELMPHLQASAFDYIIFDMPSINQTSRTLTMAGLMDKVLLVLDAENTSRDALKWGYSELVKGRADVSCIFNKTRSHAPEWLIGNV